MLPLGRAARPGRAQEPGVRGTAQDSLMEIPPP
jgi:hypothetical protein